MKSFRNRARERTPTGAYMVKENEGALKGGKEEERLPHVVVVDRHHHHHSSPSTLPRDG